MVKPKLELTEVDARRLAFAQHLIMRAHEDARLPSPLNAVAVLSAQDAVEMVLIVISQALDLDPNKYQFMAFWEAFAKRGLELPYKESMRRLNDCRSPLSIGALSRRRLILSVLLRMPRRSLAILLHALMEPTEPLKDYMVLLPMREFVNT